MHSSRPRGVDEGQHGKAWILLGKTDGWYGKVWLVSENDCCSARMFLRVCSKDDPRREPARTDAFEKALFAVHVGHNENRKASALGQVSKAVWAESFWTVLGKNPQYEPLYILWPYLTPAEQQMVVHLTRTWIAQKGRLAAENIVAKGNLLLVVRLDGWVYVTGRIGFGTFWIDSLLREQPFYPSIQISLL